MTSLYCPVQFSNVRQCSLTGHHFLVIKLGADYISSMVIIAVFSYRLRYYMAIDSDGSEYQSVLLYKQIFARWF
jgi:hypothetical protein